MTGTRTRQRLQRKQSDKPRSGRGLCEAGIIGDLRAIAREDHLEPAVLHLIEWARGHCEATDEEVRIIDEILARHAD